MYNFLINESAISAEPQISRSNKDTVEFIAVMQEADRPNRNGRIYPKTVLEQALQSPYVQERLRTKSFFCEAGHPSDQSVQRQMTIDQRNISAIVKEFWWEGNLLKAKLETANTAIGRDMKGLIEQGSQVAFSLRAQGNVHKDPKLGMTIVEAPIQIATYDWVVNPSHDKAFLESILEQTRMCLIGGDCGRNAALLTESTTLFEQGQLIPINGEVEKVEIDYAKNWHKKIKPLKEAYLYDPSDELKVEGRFAILENENATKKVMLKDYLLKDIRYKIKTLTEEDETDLGDAAAEPVHDDAEAAEHTPEVDTEDVYTSEDHEQAEDVEGIVVEAEEVETDETPEDVEETDEVKDEEKTEPTEEIEDDEKETEEVEATEKEVEEAEEAAAESEEEKSE